MGIALEAVADSTLHLVTSSNAVDPAISELRELLRVLQEERSPCEQLSAQSTHVPSSLPPTEEPPVLVRDKVLTMLILRASFHLDDLQSTLQDIREDVSETAEEVARRSGTNLLYTTCPLGLAASWHQAQYAFMTAHTTACEMAMANVSAVAKRIGDGMLSV